MRWVAIRWWDYHSSVPTEGRDNTHDGVGWLPHPQFKLLGVLYSCWIATLLYVLTHLDPLANCPEFQFTADCILDDHLWIRFAIFSLLINSAFAYVSYVTSDRSTLFTGRHGDYRDWILINLSSIPLFLTAGQFFDSHPTIFVCMFIFGTHFTYLRWILPDFLLHSFSADVFREGDLFTRASILLIACLPVSLIGMHVYWIYTHNYLGTYLMIYSPILLALYWISKTSSPEYSVHLHHYQIALLGSPLAVFPSPFSVACAGLGVSVFAEGTSRWSGAPLWTRNESKKDQ